MADTSQPTVFDYASNTQWRINFDRLPLITWFCTNANIPGVTLGEAQYPTPMSDMPLSGDKLTFDTLNIQFIVDEELRNYRELWEWIVGIGFPKSHSQWSNVLSKSKFSISKSSSFSLALGGMGFVKGAALVLPGLRPRRGRDIVVTSISLPHSGHSNSVLPKS